MKENRLAPYGSDDDYNDPNSAGMSKYHPKGLKESTFSIIRFIHLLYFKYCGLIQYQTYIGYSVIWNNYEIWYEWFYFWIVLAMARLDRYSKHWPMVISDTLIFNMQPVFFLFSFSILLSTGNNSELTYKRNFIFLKLYWLFKQLINDINFWIATNRMFVVVF